MRGQKAASDGAAWQPVFAVFRSSKASFTRASCSDCDDDDDDDAVNDYFVAADMYAPL